VTARIDTAPNALDWVVAVGRSGRVVLEFSEDGDPWTFPGTPVFTVVGLEVDITATATDNEVVIEWDEDAFEGLGGQLSRFNFDADTGTSIEPLLAGSFRILPEGFPGNPSAGTFEITVGDVAVSVDVQVAGPQGPSGVIISDTEPDDIDALWVDTTEDSPVPITVDVGTTTTLAAGSDATVVNSGDTVDVVLDFGVPKGDKGDAATVDVGTVTTLAAGADATVTNSGTVNDAILNFGLPQGDKGESFVVTSETAPDPQEGLVWSLPTNGHTVVYSGGQWWALSPTTDNLALLLTEAVLWIDADEPGAQSVPNIGSGGSALDARLGSTTGADSNDPKYLDHDGENYVHCVGAANSGLWSNVAEPTVTQVDIRVRMANVVNTANDRVIVGYRGGFAALRIGSATALGMQLRSTDTSVDATRFPNSATIPGAWADHAWFAGTFDPATRQYAYYVYSDNTPNPPASLSNWTLIGSGTMPAGSATGQWSGDLDNTKAGYLWTDIMSNNKAGGGNILGDFYGYQTRSTINGTIVDRLDVPTDLTAANATSFTSAYSDATVTIARDTSGRKTVAVTRPLWLFGTNDYMEIPDNDLLDFGAADSFTVAAVHRHWNNFGLELPLVAKRASSAGGAIGWSLGSGGTTAAQTKIQISDGTDAVAGVSGSRTAGALSFVAGVRNVTADNLITYLNASAGSPATDPTTTTLENSNVVRVGYYSAGGPAADMEFHAALVWRRALTAGEITALNTFFQTRMA